MLYGDGNRQASCALRFFGQPYPSMVTPLCCHKITNCPSEGVHESIRLLPANTSYSVCDGMSSGTVDSNGKCFKIQDYELFIYSGLYKMFDTNNTLYTWYITYMTICTYGTLHACMNVVTVCMYMYDCMDIYVTQFMNTTLAGQ